MKKIMVGLTLFIMLTFSLFAGGSKEKDNRLWFRAMGADNTIKQNFEAQITHDMGKTTVTLTWKDGRPRYAVLKEANGLYNPSVTGSRTTFSFSSLLIENASTPTEVTPLDFDDNNILVETEYSTGKLPYSLTNNEALFFDMQLENSKNNAISFSWWEYSTEKAYILLLIDEDLNYQKISFRIAPEFFVGEKDWFAAHGGDERSYQKKAIAFLSTFFPNEENSFRTYVNEILQVGMTDDDWHIFRGPEENDWKNREKRKRKESFQRAFIKHFKYYIEEIDYDNKSLNFPYLDFKKGSFDSIYGAYRNIASSVKFMGHFRRR